jgi:TRAP-type C4-dicarboxylate transport system permease small subunit
VFPQNGSIMIPLLRRAEKAIGKGEMTFCVLCMVAIVVSTSLSIIFRYLLQSPLIWASDAGTLALVWLTFVGSAVLLKEGGHVAIAGLVKWLPRRSLRVVGLLSTLVIGLSMLTVGWFAVQAARVQWGQEIIALRISRAFYSIPIVVAALSSALTVALEVLSLAAGLASAGPGKEP